MESPLAIQTLVQGAVFGKYPRDLIALGEGEEVDMGTLLVQCVTLRALPFIPLRCLLASVAIAWHQALSHPQRGAGEKSESKRTYAQNLRGVFSHDVVVK